MSSLGEVSLAPIEKIEVHPNADRLEIAYVWGMPGIVGKGDFVENEEVVVVPYDHIIPNDDNFDEVFRNKRVRPMRLRGIFSMCVILKNSWGFGENDNISEKLNITKWEPPLVHEKGMNYPKSPGGPPPPGVLVFKYDIESLLKYYKNILPDEKVVITEKLEGCNAKYTHSEGVLYVGSRNRWISKKG